MMIPGIGWNLRIRRGSGEDILYLSIHGLVWYLSWDLVCPHWLLNRSFPEAKVRPDEGERHRHPKPECQQRHEREEGDGGRGPVIPEHQVEDEEVGKDDAGTEHAGQEDVGLPLLSTKALVDPSGNISGRGAKANKKDESAGHEGAPVGGGEEAKAGKDQGDAGHAEELGA